MERLARRIGRCSGELQVGGGLFAALDVHVVSDPLAFIQTAKPSRLNGRNMNENILTAILRHYEPIALGGVEPLNRADSHPSVTLSLGVTPDCATLDNRTFGTS